jgi:F0F1-type ATP synthase delta subunit
MVLTGIATVDVILAQQIEENGLEEITVAVTARAGRKPGRSIRTTT